MDEQSRGNQQVEVIRKMADGNKSQITGDKQGWGQREREMEKGM